MLAMPNDQKHEQSYEISGSGRRRLPGDLQARSLLGLQAFIAELTRGGSGVPPLRILGTRRSVRSGRAKFRDYLHQSVSDEDDAAAAAFLLTYTPEE